MERLSSDDPELIAIDTETEGVAFYDQAYCVTLCWRDGRGGLQSHYFAVPDCTKELRIHLPGRRWCFHNSKFDLQKLILAGVIERERLQAGSLEDTEALAHLLDESRLKGLKPLARSILGETTDEEEKLRVLRRRLKKRKKDGYKCLPSLNVAPYAMKDAEFTLRLYEVLYPQLAQTTELLDLYRSEMELTLVLLDMETAGMRVDFDYLDGTIKEQSDQLLRINLDIEDAVGRPIKEGQKVDPEQFFNPNAPAQVLAELQARGAKKIKNTQKDTIKDLKDPLAKMLIERKHIKKLLDTYLIPIMEEQRDGIFHGNFRQHGTRTGRLSSGAASD